MGWSRLNHCANPSFDARRLTSTTLVTRCTASLEAIQDSPDFGSQLAAARSRSMAREVDYAGLLGSGSPPGPQGLLSATGVNTVTSVGTPINYAEMITGVQWLLEDGVPLGAATQAVVMDPAVWAVYANLATRITNDNSPLPRSATLANTQFLIASAHTLCSPQNQNIFMGDWSERVFGVRMEASVEALKLWSHAGNPAVGSFRA
jgi:HK97 family phage major capsid protein